MCLIPVSTVMIVPPTTTVLSSSMMPVSRKLLARVRDVMAGADKAQQRLDKIVSVIADDMVAEVCSVYVIRPGEVLELFSTKGLNASAVHNTRLRVGEGLIWLSRCTCTPYCSSGCGKPSKLCVAS